MEQPVQTSRSQQRITEECGSGFDGIYAHSGEPDCPYPPKPDPATLFAAADDLDIDLGSSWLIGDADRDIELGHKAGLAGAIRGRNPMIDGFGLIAFASLTPMIFVMAYGMIV